MTNNTFHKYLNIYTANRHYNDTFDKWLTDNYKVTVSTAAWSYGEESFIDRVAGERAVSEAAVMQRYVKSKKPYFRWFDEVDDYLASDFTSIEEWWAKKSA